MIQKHRVNACGSAFQQIQQKITAGINDCNCIVLHSISWQSSLIYFITILPKAVGMVLVMTTHDSELGLSQRHGVKYLCAGIGPHLWGKFSWKNNN